MGEKSIKNNYSNQSSYKWDIDVSILNNRFILGELLRVLSIAVFITVLIVLAISLPQILSGSLPANSSNSRDALYASILILMLFVFTALFILVFYGNLYKLTFVLNDKRVLMDTRAEQRKRNHLINSITILLGLLSGKPAVAGAGMLAGMNQSSSMSWKKVKKAFFFNSKYTIVMKQAYGIKMIIFCTPDNYEAIKSFALSLLNSQCMIINRR